MILVDLKDRSGNHYINERSLTFSENDLGDPQRIAVSMVSGTVVMVMKDDDGDGVVIPRAFDGGYEKWTLKGYSTKIPEGRNAAHYIFARLSRLERTALIVFSLNNYNIDGSVSMFTTNEDGSVTELRSEASSDYYYIRIGYLSETDGVSDRVLTYDSGRLGIGYEIDKLKEAWSDLFVPHYDNPANPEELTWIEAKSHLGINGGMTSFVDTGNPDLPKIYDGLPIDWETIYWELDENGKKTVLKAKGGGEGTLAGIEVTGEGNAITNVVPSSDGTKLIFSKLSTFVEKPYLDNGFYNRAYIEDHYYSKDSIDGTFPTKSYVDDTFATSADFNSLQSSFNDFLTGSDTDNIINKWKELENFLDGMAESDDLAAILSNKAEQSALESLSGVVDTKWTQDNDKILSWDTAYGWGDHSKAGYALKTYVDQQDNALRTYMDSTFVGIKGDYTIEGTKNFVGSLQVNGSPITYNAANRYWKLEGDLLLTGALSTFSSDTAFTPSTVMDGVVTDDVTITKNAYGQLEVIAAAGGGGVDEDAVRQLIESYSYITLSDLPTATTSVKGIASFDSSDFSVSSGKVSLSGARVKVVSSTASMTETGTLYIIV